MVRKLVAGMTRMPFVAILALALLALGVAVALQPRPASAANYSDPWWTLASASPECLCDTCGCEGPSEWTEPGVSVRTGELRWHFPLFSTPGMVETHEFSLLHRSTISGRTQFGQGVIPAFFPTAQKVILDANNPNGNGGHKVVLRLETGQVAEFLWGGSSYSTTACSFHSTLTKNGSGNSVLTDLHNNAWVFDSNGMPDTYTDRNGNVLDWTFNGSLQWTGLTDDRGRTYTVHSNTAGYIDYLDDPAGNRWTFAYDSNDRLSTITTPTTPDQAYGITTTLSWDASGRFTGVTDGRGNTPWTISYSGTSTTVSSASDGTNSISFSYTSGRTDVTDRAGTVTRHHYTGPTSPRSSSGSRASRSTRPSTAGRATT